MTRNPILPDRRNPAGQGKRIGAAHKAVSAHLSKVRGWLLSEIAAIPVEVYEVNSALGNERRYEYFIDLVKLQSIIAELKRRMGDGNAQAVVSRVIEAYAEGTAKAAVNLAAISADYTREATAVLQSSPYMRRVALVGARVFEEMDGFAGSTATDLARVLQTALSDGRNPRVIARQVRDRFGVAQSRALTIARTEMTGALRRGRWDEAQDAQERLGIRTGLMHFAALLPNTRPSHAERHGEVYTVDEVREWYSRDANGINCQCAQTEMLLDDDGNPISDKLVAREQGKRDKFEASRKPE